MWQSFGLNQPPGRPRSSGTLSDSVSALVCEAI